MCFAWLLKHNRKRLIKDLKKGGINMAQLVHENITRDEYEAVDEGKVHYHVMKNENVEVGDLVNFNIVGDMLGEVTPTPEVFRVTHKLVHEANPGVAKGYAVVTLRRLVEAKK